MKFSRLKSIEYLSLNNEYRGNYSTFKLSPLTRDGGARLIHDKDLKYSLSGKSW